MPAVRSLRRLSKTGAMVVRVSSRASRILWLRPWRRLGPRPVRWIVKVRGLGRRGDLLDRARGAAAYRHEPSP